MAQLYGTQLEAKPPMKRWKKIVLGLLALFAVFIAAKFTEDTFNERSSLCRYMGGTADPRGFYQKTKRCFWTRDTLKRMNEHNRSPTFGVEHAKRFCDMEKGAFQVPQQDLLQCVFS